MNFRLHRYGGCNDIIKGTACAAVYSLCYNVCQWLVPDLSPYRFYESAAICALLVAGNLTVWQYDKKWIRTLIFYNGIVLSAAFIPLLSGQRVLHEEIAHAFVMGTAVFFCLSSLQTMAWQVRFSPVRRFCLGMVYLLGAGFLLVPFLFWGYYVVSGHVLSSAIVLTLFQTNGSEAMSYLKDQNVFLWCLTGAMVLSGIVIMMYILYRAGRKTGPYPLWIQLLLALVTLAGSLYVMEQSSSYLPVRIMDETENVLQEYQKYGQAKAVRQERLKSLQNLRVSSSGGIFVLVIGESENRDHMQAYGYDRPDTPWLSQQAGKADTILFTHAYSNHSLTVPVLTYALSEKNQYNDIPLEDACSLMEVAKAAGYDTFWLSNQRHYGAWDTPVAEIASTADYQLWLNERNGTEDCRTNYFDDILADKIPDLEESSNALIVIHLMGSHGSYGDRYPQQWDIFHGENERIDQYDNSVGYTDYVLQKIYDRVKTQPRFKGFIYVSDHGEEVNLGYFHEATKFTYSMSHIPFVMIFSDTFIQEYPQMVETLRNHRESYWTNDLLYDIMVSLMGFDGVSTVMPDLDLTSDGYSLDRGTIRTLHGTKKIEE